MPAFRRSTKPRRTSSPSCGITSTPAAGPHRSMSTPSQAYTTGDPREVARGWLDRSSETAVPTGNLVHPVYIEDLASAC